MIWRWTLSYLKALSEATGRGGSASSAALSSSVMTDTKSLTARPTSSAIARRSPTIRRSALSGFRSTPASRSDCDASDMPPPTPPCELERECDADCIEKREPDGAAQDAESGPPSACRRRGCCEREERGIEYASSSCCCVCWNAPLASGSFASARVCGVTPAGSGD